MKYCHQCGAQLSDGVAFCSSCGHAVASTATAEVSPVHDVIVAAQTAEPPTAPAARPQLGFCVKCGAHIAREAAFCSSCGSPRMQVAEPLRPRTGADNRAQNALIIEIAAGILGFLGIGHMYGGRTGLGVALLIGWWVGIAVLTAIATTGIGACLSLPLWIAVPVFSGIQARDYVRNEV